MQLQTSRLTLSSIDVGDLSDMHKLHTLPEIDEYNTLGIPVNIQETENLLNDWITADDSYVFSAKLRGSNEFVGLVGLETGKAKFKSGEVWYKTMPSFWKQGYTSEALHEVLSFGFRELKLHRITAGCAVNNAGSIAVLKKAGMTLEGTKRKVLPIRGEWIDSYSYSILDTEF